MDEKTITLKQFKEFTKDLDENTIIYFSKEKELFQINDLGILRTKNTKRIILIGNEL